ncbi:MAG: hypothetical protein COC16_02870 [Lutibacter sp.]|nr:MAG: hypothetical protein COC16_02870 [Lutibacter sp.]
MSTATLLLIILAVFTALFIAVFQYLFHNKEKSRLNYWLSFFRFSSIFLILLLLINPSIIKKKVEIVKPKLLIAVDNSTSIKYNSQNETVIKLVQLIKNSKALNDKYSINYYGFGNNLYELDSLNFNENQTNLAVPFQEFLRLYKNKMTPVILISDGNQTIGNNIEFITYENPVFPFIVGDTTVFEDIYIQRINVNMFTNLKNKFPVELFVNYTGNKSISKKLTIYHKGTNVFSKQLHFSKTDNVKTESFYLTAITKGSQYYTATIEQLENEQNTINNRKDFSIKVIEETAKILILTSVLHPDLGMFKKSIESNRQRDVSIINSVNFKGNLSDYQLIILYQPTSNFDKIMAQISTKKLNYFIITGLNTDWGFLNKIQGKFKKEAIFSAENYYPLLNLSYASFINEDIDFKNFQPLTDQFGKTSFFVPYNTLLFKKIGAIDTEQPLLATFENNLHRGAVLFGENMWSWRMASHKKNKSFESFDGFMSNLIQYLSSSNRKKRFNISVKSFYHANERIKFSASYLDKNFNFDNRAKLWLTISNSENSFSKKIPFAISGARYIAELSNIPHDDYTYAVSIENNNERALGNFKVLPFEVEQQFATANKHALELLAAKTGGNTYFYTQEPKLVEDLKNDTRFKSIQKINYIKTPLINWKWILGIIILLFSVEWFTRKYFGEI